MLLSSEHCLPPLADQESEPDIQSESNHDSSDKLPG